MENFETKWCDLLREAVTQPGMILKAYTAFHAYSPGNQLLALWQCQTRQLEPGPLSTYPGWQAKGRLVKRGERALVLCVPLTAKRRADDEGGEDAIYVRFVYKRSWFVFAQTDGEPIEIQATPAWDRTRALDTLNVTEIPFAHLDGNCMG